MGGSWTSHGIHERITGPGGFHVPIPMLTVAVEIESAIGDRVGQLPFAAALVDEDGGCVARITGEIASYAPIVGLPVRQWVALVFGPGGDIPHPGLYRVDITIDGQLLGGERVMFFQA